MIEGELSLVIRRLIARAELDDRAEAARATEDRAARGGEEDAWLLEQWLNGRVVLARLTVSAEGQDEKGHDVKAQGEIGEAWLERGVPPVVEEQIAQVAPAQLPLLAAELRERGVNVDDAEVTAGHLHVELGEGLVSAVAGEA